MSTKTTFKRVALVAVAALGLGVLSVAPSQAATQADTLSISANTASVLTGETATATLTGTFVSGANAYSDTLTVVASATALPSAILPTLTASDTANAVVAVDGLSATIMNVAAAATATSGKITVDVVVPANSTPGTYAYKFTPSVQGGGNLNSSAVTFTVTVTAAPADDTAVSVAKSTTWLSSGETVTSTSTTTSDSATVVAKTASTNQAATIEVITKNAAGTTLATNPALTVIVKSGTPGLVGKQAKSSSSLMVSAGRAISTTSGDVIGVFSDGTEGVSEVEIYSGTTLLATKKVTFYGAVASYGVTSSVTGSIAVNGNATLTVTGADKAANETAAPSVHAVSSDTSVATVPAGAATTHTVTGVKSGTATITLCDTAACAAATITKTIVVKVGATTAKTVTITFDKPTPTAGEKVTATVTALDASGNAVADGARLLLAAGGFSSSVSVANSSTIPTVETVTLTAGIAEYIFYAPAAGVVTFTATEGDATDSTTKGTITGSVTVLNPALDAATAAAELAEAAAQDATDAALDATEAATLAGALAQEAVDAVADLSVEVTKLIGALKAQITKLTNLVIKIQKKIK